MTSYEVLDWLELCRKYPHRWVAANVLAREDAGGQPVRFEVIMVNADMYSARTDLGKSECCIIYTGSIPEEKYVMMY